MNRSRIALACVLLATSAGAAGEKRLVGYFAEWSIYQRKYTVSDIPAQSLTHVNYAFARIVRHDISVERVRELDPMALILSGGPSSVYDHDARRCDPALFDLDVPILGLCYGLQLACEVPGRAGGWPLLDRGGEPLRVLALSGGHVNRPHFFCALSAGARRSRTPDQRGARPGVTA